MRYADIRACGKAGGCDGLKNPFVAWHYITHPRGAYNLWKGDKVYPTLQSVAWSSVTPFALGDSQVKYAATPCDQQAQYGGPVVNPIVAGNLVDSGIDPERVGQRVLESVLAKEMYIFTHPDMRSAVQMRFARIMAGFDAADASPALAGMDYTTPDLTAGVRPSGG